MNQPVPPPAPAKGLIARAIGIITSPRSTYEDVVRSPRPFGILLLVVGATAVMLVALAHQSIRSHRTPSARAPVVAATEEA